MRKPKRPAPVLLILLLATSLLTNVAGLLKGRQLVRRAYVRACIQVMNSEYAGDPDGQALVPQFCAAWTEQKLNAYGK